MKKIMVLDTMAFPALNAPADAPDRVGATLSNLDEAPCRKMSA